MSLFRNHFTITSLFLFFILILIINKKHSFEKSFRHLIIDSFEYQKDSTMIKFKFIEVSEYDAIFIKDLLAKFRNLNNKNEFDVEVIYFFKDSDKQELPKNEKSIISKLYPKKKNLHNKLAYYPNGYLFTLVHNSEFLKFKNKNIKANQLVRMPLILPKKGTNAYYILFDREL